MSTICFSFFYVSPFAVIDIVINIIIKRADVIISTIYAALGAWKVMLVRGRASFSFPLLQCFIIQQGCMAALQQSKRASAFRKEAGPVDTTAY